MTSHTLPTHPPDGSFAATYPPAFLALGGRIVRNPLRLLHRKPSVDFSHRRRLCPRPRQAQQQLLCRVAPLHPPPLVSCRPLDSAESSQSPAHPPARPLRCQAATPQSPARNESSRSGNDGRPS